MKKKVGLQEEKNGSEASDEIKERDGLQEEWRQVGILKIPTKFYTMNHTFLDMKIIYLNPIDTEMNEVKLSSDEAAQFLSMLSIQVNFLDNIPAKILKHLNNDNVMTVTGLHGLASAQKLKINGRFRVIFIVDIRSYEEGFKVEDPQKQLLINDKKS